MKKQAINRVESIKIQLQKLKNHNTQFMEKQSQIYNSELTLSSDTIGSLPMRDIIDDIEQSEAAENEAHEESMNALRRKYMLNLLDDNDDTLELIDDHSFVQ